MSGGGDKVGYGKPPKASRFKKGKSGNSTGRPKGSTKASAIDRVLGRKVSVTVDGKRKMVDVSEAILLSLVGRAVRGDRAAARDAIRLIEKYERLAAAPASRSPPENQGPRVVTISTYGSAASWLLKLGLLVVVDEERHPGAYTGPKISDKLFEFAMSELPPGALDGVELFDLPWALETPALVGEYFGKERLALPNEREDGPADDDDYDPDRDEPWMAKFAD